MPIAKGSQESGESHVLLFHLCLYCPSVASILMSSPRLGNESPPQGRSATTDNTKNPDASGQDPKPSAPGQSSDAASTAVPPEPPRKHHRLLPLSSRTSLKADRPSTSDKTQDGPHDGSENTLRGSRRSLLRGRRDRSKGSSMRSREQNAGEPSMEENKTVNHDVRGPPKSERQPKPSRKLFAFLSCCSSSDVDPEDGPIPPKKTSRRPSVPQTQPTPEKKEANAADSSTAEAKEPSLFKDEKPNMTVTPDQPTSQLDEGRTDGNAEQSSQFDGTKNSSMHPEPANEASSRALTENLHPEPQPSVPSEAAAANATVSEKPDDITRADEDVAEDQKIDDPTQPVTSEDDTKQVPQGEEAMRIPPPPPLGKQPETIVQEKSQQWLLPPALPHLKDRKCLVLDLDETLVHSSFKVIHFLHFLEDLS